MLTSPPWQTVVEKGKGEIRSHAWSTNGWAKITSLKFKSKVSNFLTFPSAFLSKDSKISKLSPVKVRFCQMGHRLNFLPLLELLKYLAILAISIRSCNVPSPNLNLSLNLSIDIILFLNLTFVPRLLFVIALILVAVLVFVLGQYWNWY